MMRDELLDYYERELAFVRQMGAEFADKYPKIATRLLLEADRCEDPHVERLIEGFAFLAARVRLKLDDEFPEITESLLNVLYPHYLAPIPAMSIAKFSLDPDQGKLTTGFKIDRWTVLYSRPVQGTPCRFRSAYPVTLWPIEITDAALESLDPVDTRGKWREARIRISLHCLNGTRLSGLSLPGGGQIDRLRFYINADPQLAYHLYELIFNNAATVELKQSGPASRGPAPITLPPASLAQVGFESNEAMLPYTPRSFAGYRLLTEYLAFPEKFLFFDVTGLDLAARAGFGDQVDIVIYLKDVVPPRSAVDPENFQLGCSPIINHFEKTAEPIQLNRYQSEYHVIPDVHRQMATEVYSIDGVTSADPYLQRSIEYQPFYSFRHSYEQEPASAFWYATRRPSERKEDPGTEVFISFVDLNFSPHYPSAETVTLHTTCTNRDLPGKLPFGGREGDFDVENAAQLSMVRCLRKPSGTLRPPMKRGAHWRLLSHLALNHLSISSAGGSPDALREILMLYDFGDSAATRRQIEGIESVTAKRVLRRVGSHVGAGFVRGVETTIGLDEEKYVGSGVFLFACLIERFLGLYASVNSFNQLVAKTRQREGVLKRWPPRAGEQIVL